MVSKKFALHSDESQSATYSILEQGYVYLKFSFKEKNSPFSPSLVLPLHGK
jgi:hypothetical protein